jgi:hypothetical protein
MRRAFFLFFFLLTALSVVTASAASDERERKTDRFPYVGGGVTAPRIEPGRVVVKLSAEALRLADDRPVDALPRGIAAFDALGAKHSVTGGRRAIVPRGIPPADPELFQKVGLDRVWILELGGPLSEAGTWGAVRDFARERWVEYAEPVYVAEPTAIPNDPSFPQQWTHRNVGQTVGATTGTPDADADTDLAWDTVTGSPARIVAVLDSGADLDHPDLVANLLPGWDYVNDDPLPEDATGHGTAVAGIAAARGNNGIGVAGVCWTCGILPLAIGNSVHEAEAIRFAADSGAATINMSHTFGAVWIELIIDAIAYANEIGALPFASATNVNGYNVGTPAVYPGVVSVGGSNQHDVRVYAYNDLTELTAPGPNAMSTSLNGNYTLFAGTSSSSPFAAALGALLRSHEPDLHVRELRHVLRLGCDDEVGAPAEDTPGWDEFMGYGRVNADRTLDILDGPWLALDRPHYMCTGELTVALKDTTAGSTVAVTLRTSGGGDAETVLVTPVAGADGYYEGTIPLSWAGVDGPVVASNGTLDVAHGETLSATAGSLAATAFADCTKKVCQWPDLGLEVRGDCDGDRNLDPGELWRVAPALVNLQTERLRGVRATLTTTHPNVAILKPEATWGDLTPFSGGFPTEEDAFRVQLAAGAPVAAPVVLQLAISGDGWAGDAQACTVESGLTSSFHVLSNRDLGQAVATWDFDDGTAMGFASGVAHGTGPPSGDLSECVGHYADRWEDLPVTDRAHSGMHSMRLGNGTAYGASVDAALVTPSFTVPSSGGAIGFRLFIDSAPSGTTQSRDGLVVEAKRPADPLWSYLEDGSYGHRQAVESCGASGIGARVPFGAVEQVPLVAGDGALTAAEHDTFDAAHHASLARFAGQTVQVRFRFGAHDGSSPGSHGQGAWIDTVRVHQGYVADAWPGGAPSGLAGSAASCPAGFDLAWNPVAGAGSYEIHRSETSCADAASALVPVDVTASPSYHDDTVVPDVVYHWAIAARETGSGCPTVRACVSGSCPCVPPADPTGLVLDRDGNDVLLAWFGSADAGPTWNVYRDASPDPSGWGGPLAAGVTDGDPGTPGVQYRDAGGVPAGALQHYLVTEVGCAESPFPP